jgi:mannose-6-phosphate isomerase-like protein (cupin superfamily)
VTVQTLLSTARGELLHATCARNAGIAIGRRAGCFQALYVLSGTGEVVRRGEQVEGVTGLSPGRWIAIPAGTAAACRAGAASDLVFVLARVPPPGGDAGLAPAAGPDLDLAGRATTERSAGTLAVAYDTLAPDGSEIRFLAADPTASMVHCRLPPGAASRPVRHRAVLELWYVLSGRGDLWRDGGGAATVTVTGLRAGVAVEIRPGTAFQFRARGGEPLTFVILTMPAWPGADEAQPAPPGHWR